MNERPVNDSLTNNKKTRIVVRAPNWIGDQVMAYPFFVQLRERYPQAHIAVMCVPWVESIQFRNLVDEVIVLTPPKNAVKEVGPRWWVEGCVKLRALEQNATLLKEAGPWDIGISLPNSFSAAWIFYRAGVKDRRGYDADARGWLLNTAVPLSKDQGGHRAQSYLRLIPGLEAASLDVDAFTDVWAHVWQKFDPVLAWPDTNPHVCPLEKFWILAPGTMAESRRWPIEKFEALAEQIAERTNYVGIVLGGAAEAALAAKLCQNPKLRLQDWTQRGTVASYWKLFQQAKFTVCNDSGLAHVASLCGSPVFITWGAGNASRTKPLGPGKVNIITNPVDCWPCEKNTCHQPSSKYLQCIRGIGVERVAGMIDIHIAL